MFEPEAAEILNSARSFKSRCDELKRQIGWSDYETYKSELHRKYLFGYESELARILGL